MSNQDDQPNWRRAPADATHWGPDSNNYSECWYKKEGGIWWFAKAWVPSKTWHPMQNPPSKFRFGKMIKRK